LKIFILLYKKVTNGIITLVKHVLKLNFMNELLFFGHNAINTHPKCELCFLQMPNYSSIVAKNNNKKSLKFKQLFSIQSPNKGIK